MAGIVLKDIGKKYDNSDKFVIRNFDLEIKDKEFLVLVGPSGCGKTTILRMIAGLEEISEGKLYIGQRLVNDLEPKDRDIAMVFQNYALYPHLTVFGNIAYPLKQRRTKKYINGKEKEVKYTKEEIQEKVEKVAELLDVKHLLRRKPKQLSGGERQRVALARAMVRSPRAFLMDEPLSNLDAQLRTQTRSEILKLHKNIKTTFVYVTHDQTEALTMGDRIAIIDHGKIQQVAAPYEVFYHPANVFVAKFIGSPAMNLIEAVCEEKNERREVIVESLGVKFMIDKRVRKTGKVILGVRPENIAIVDSETDSIKMQVDYSELLGTESVLHLMKDDVEIRCKVPTEMYRGEKELNIRVDVEKIHLFDPETEENIIWDSAEN